MKVNSNKIQSIIIAGGGTGGHIFPAIAIAQALLAIQPSLLIHFIGAKGKMEMDKIPAAGFTITGIDIAGFNRSSLIKNITLPFKIIKSFFQVKAIFKKHQPLVVIGVGGYSTFPVVKYAQWKGLPTYLHEGNLLPGKSNIVLAKNATNVFTVLKGLEKYFPISKIIVSGNPIRAAIANATITKQQGLEYFNLKQNKKTVLVIGGSLGAKSINDSIESNLSFFSNSSYQLIWQAGNTNFSHYAEVVKNYDNIFISNFINEMQYAYAAADMVISRAGAIALAELCVCAKPVIFVPYPFAAEDHQTANAMALVNKQAAILIPDVELQQKLFPTLQSLLENTVLLTQLSNNIKLHSISNAAQIIATHILNNKTANN